MKILIIYLSVALIISLLLFVWFLIARKVLNELDVDTRESVLDALNGDISTNSLISTSLCNGFGWPVVLLFIIVKVIASIVNLVRKGGRV